jgi:hypothetical protein
MGVAAVMGNKEKMMMPDDGGLVDACQRVDCDKDVWGRSVFARDRAGAIISSSISASAAIAREIDCLLQSQGTRSAACKCCNLEKEIFRSCSVGSVTFRPRRRRRRRDGLDPVPKYKTVLGIECAECALKRLNGQSQIDGSAAAGGDGIAH